MNEALKKALAMLDSKVLTESVQKEITEAFDSAVEAGVEAKVSDLKESMESNLNAIVETKLGDLKEKFDRAVEAKAKEMNEDNKDKLVESIGIYLSEVKDAWLQENKVAIQAEIDIKKAEKVLEKVADLATVASVDLHEITQTDFDAKHLLDESVNEKAILKKEILDLKKEKILDEACKDLTAQKAEGLKGLCESIETSDLEKFETQVKAFKDTLVEGVVKPLKEKKENTFDIEY